MVSMNHPEWAGDDKAHYTALYPFYQERPDILRMYSIDHRSTSRMLFGHGLIWVRRSDNHYIYSSRKMPS